MQGQRDVGDSDMANQRDLVLMRMKAMNFE
jgi:hypothetical protein